ncbi:MAG: DUF3095 domain-containing protein [Proteobacteria bacterium]|nr:DUF3095 domain-containing protein [Pseudomonadota bacterium]
MKPSAVARSAQKADTRSFYRDLEPLATFEDATNGAKHTAVPDDWLLVVCDIVDSTTAIEAGLYKNVNTIGAATIVAVLNVDRWIPIPFVFGGDGATFAIPPCMEDGVRCALLGAQELARNGFNLDLRIGMIPVLKARELGDRVALSKYSINKGVYQASLSGFGWGYAEALLKAEATRAEFEVAITSRHQAHTDFTGFECRWKPVPARNGHKLAILVQSLARDPKEHMAVLSDVLGILRSIYGDSIDLHPIDSKHLIITMNPAEIMDEIRVRTKGLSIFKSALFIMKLAPLLVFGRIVIGLGLKVFGIDWASYKEDVVQNSDFRKFDGALKMVVDGSDDQRRRLEDYLELAHRSKKLVYGTHASKAAIMTCLVFSHGEHHAHFVDGSEGGYTIAAKMLKRQLAEYRADLAASTGKIIEDNLPPRL